MSDRMNNAIPNSVYGPVDSWRLGKSLGIDVLCVDSICSFECVYFQLGKINLVITERDVFVSTEQVLKDLEASDWRNADVITFSGSGEPTLAVNLGEVITKAKELTGKPIVVLTNSSLLTMPEVRRDLAQADRIFCKLDGWSEDVFKRIDRPADKITLKSIVSGIRNLRDEYTGFLAIQTMILRSLTGDEVKRYAEIVRSLGPDEIQLYLPHRPIPEEYQTETRGNDPYYAPVMNQLKTIGKTEFESIRSRLSKLTDVPVVMSN